MLVNEVLVLDVDQGSEVDNKGGQKQEAPLGSDLDEEVADESGEEGLDFCQYENTDSTAESALQEW